MQKYIYISVIITFFYCSSTLAQSEQNSHDLDLRQYQSNSTSNSLSKQQLKELVKMLYKNKKIAGKPVEQMSDAELVKALGSELQQVKAKAGERNKLLQDILDEK